MVSFYRLNSTCFHQDELLRLNFARPAWLAVYQKGNCERIATTLASYRNHINPEIHGVECLHRSHQHDPERVDPVFKHHNYCGFPLKNNKSQAHPRHSHVKRAP